MTTFTKTECQTSAAESDFVYVFHHFIKCGGTTITDVLRGWFKIVNDHLVSLYAVEDYKSSRIDLASLKPDDCMIGHYAVEGTHVFERYPELLSNSGRFRLFTFLRDPLEFCVSFYFYSKNEGRMNQTLKEFIESNRNLLAYYMHCYYDCRDVMDRYFFIGVTERMEESLLKLSKLVNRTLPEVRILNKTKRDGQVEIIDEAFKKWFKDYNDIDYKMYEYACSRLDGIA